ncbi:FAD-binding oxidoreductase [Okibacterium endophyticum]
MTPAFSPGPQSHRRDDALQINRRQVLLLAGAALALAGCASPDATPSASPTPTVRPTVTPADWQSLAGKLTGSLVMPGDADYATLKLLENPRYDGVTPLGILEAANSDDVAAGISFAARFGIPLEVRSGGHSYPGYSGGGGAGTGVDPSLVIDLRPLDTVSVAADGMATIGPGAALATVYNTLAGSGRAIGAGSCATVGVSGLTLGGGVGVLTRTFGLTCDQVQSMQVVTADGTVRTASASSEPDLFWALRGGGGGHIGVVTEFTFATQQAPEVTMFVVTWPMSQAARVIDTWQSWMPQTDSRLWTTLKVLGGAKHPSGPALSMSGTWLGPASDLAAQLAGITGPNPPTQNTSNTHSYGDAMMSYAGCLGVAIDQCNTGPNGQLTRESFSATSHIATKALSADGIQALLAQASAASGVSGLTEGGISIDALGGAVASVGAGDTAVPWRDAIATVQYTATFADGSDPDAFDQYVRGFRAAMVPFWGDGAYVNYADASLDDPLKAYFGDNAAKLKKVRATYDPNGVFTQPQ